MSNCSDKYCCYTLKKQTECKTAKTKEQKKKEQVNEK